ncbi:MAG TPA: pyridoxamine 5'-phosphate oxidase [Rhodoplanes sp.]|jgi:pyridoxamine 5'-phosphate oxidase|nr:pyridoxamine 5'-phosphate oxidase [Rhodoplanes sp.]
MSEAPPIEQRSWLTAGDFTEADEPLRLFAHWFAEASRTEPADANAMALATVGPDGLPNVRMVLLKGFDERGFVFYTNENSQKGQELAANPQAAVVFHWKSLQRQVRLRGGVTIVSEAEADAYFASRPRISQIGAWASQQSRPLESRLAFEKAVAFYTAKHLAGAIPRPPHWRGYCLLPSEMEFWQDRPFRLHDRIVFSRDAPDAPWTRTRLYP